MDVEGILEANAQHEILEVITESGCLEGAAHGIALQVLKSGRDSLSSKQEYVFQKFVAEKYFDLDCSRCHIPMPTCEIAYALSEDDGLCSWCRKMESNYD